MSKKTIFNHHIRLAVSSVMISTILVSCVSIPNPQAVVTEGSQPPAVITVATDKQPFYQALNSLILPPTTPQPAAPGVIDGPYRGMLPEGQEFTTYVKNGYYDEFLVVYHTNFVNQLRVDLVNGLYEGWVTYRLPTSIINQKVLFHQGIPKEAILYNEAKLPTFHFWFIDGQPSSGIRYDNNGNAVESMF